MTSLAPFLIIAQAAFLPVMPPGNAMDGNHRGSPPEHTSRHGRAAATPSPTPRVRITVVNATCVPAISFSALRSRDPLNPNPETVSYPLFRQGTWTSDEPFEATEFRFTARTTNGIPIAEWTIRFRPLSSQTLLLTGDLSRSGTADKLPQLNAPQSQPIKTWAPNFQFHLYPEEVGCPDPCHYRIVNAMPSRILVLKTVPEGNKPARQLGLLTPGNSLLLVKQPPCVEWTAEIDGQSYPVSILQEGAAANCLIPFFLREGKPAFVRIFEDP